MSVVNKNIKEFQIQYPGLKDGVHEFYFPLSHGVISELGVDEVTEGDLMLNIFLDKKVNLLNFQFKFGGKIYVSCDRCGDKLPLKINNTFKLIAKPGNKYEEITEELIVIPENDGIFNFTQFLFEFIKLCVPQKNTHSKETECNKEIIKKLKELNTNHNATDPRWEALKNLKLN